MYPTPRRATLFGRHGLENLGSNVYIIRVRMYGQMFCAILGTRMPTRIARIMNTCSHLNVRELTDHAETEQTIVFCSGVGVSRRENLKGTTNVPRLDPLPPRPAQQEHLPDSRSS